MIAKELRALAPVWAAAAAAMLAPVLVRELRPLNVPVYFLGSLVLGAMSIGHEYSHRTLGLMLTQPVSRARLLLTKLAVLAVLLIGLLLLSFVALSAGRGEAMFGDAIRWLPALAGLFITPYLTLATRSPMAGVVFTLAIAGVLMIVGEWLGVAKYGGYSADVERFRVLFLSRMLVVLSVAGAVMTWWTFSRLEVLDGRGTEIDFGRVAATGTASRGVTRRSPIRLLIEKELRLQQLAFVVAAIYVMVYLAAISRARGMFSHDDAGFMLSILYALVLAVLIGSVASAEERHLRVLDAQLLVPMSASRQWLIKVAIVLGLTFVLTVALPAGLAVLFPPERILWARTLASLAAAGPVLAVMSVAVVSLYVSTLCSSALWALLLSVPSAFGVAVFVLELGEIVQRYFLDHGVRPDRSVVQVSAGIVAIAVIALVLRFASVNHRYLDRSHWRTAAHAGIAAAAIAAGATLVVVAGMTAG